MELSFMTLKDYKLKAASETFDPIVDGFLNRKEFMLLHAAAKTGKSMLALNLGLAVATGADFLGMETFKSKVMYLQTEIAPSALADRIEAMLSGTTIETYDLAQLNFLVADNRIRLDSKTGMSLLGEVLVKESPSLLIIDPFYDLHSKNEDNATEMAPILSDIREMAREIGCAILLIHHQGKKGESFSSNAGHACRGSSSFADVPDCSVSMSRDKAGYSLRGIFRNRAPLEDLRLAFDDRTFTFHPTEAPPKKVKTRDLIIQEIRDSQGGLTKKELVGSLGRQLGIQASAVQKQIEVLRAEGLLAMASGEFKNTRFKLSDDQGGNPLP